MSLKVTLIFSIVILTWATVSAEVRTYNIYTTAEIQKVAGGEPETKTKQYPLSRLKADGIPYSSFNENTLVIAKGVSTLASGVTEPLVIKSFVLDQYEEVGEKKIYKASIAVGSVATIANQHTFVELTMIIKRVGMPRFWINIGAGACDKYNCSVSTLIEQVKIAV